MGGGGKEEEEEEEEEEIPDGYLPKASALTFRTCTPGFCLLNNNQFSAIWSTHPPPPHPLTLPQP